MNNYMSVEELKSEYLEQLKMKLYYMNREDLKNEFEYIKEEHIKAIEKALYWQDISDEIVFYLFSCISFVKEDFESEVE